MCPLKTNNYKQGVLEGNIDSCQAEAATKFLHIFFFFFFFRSQWRETVHYCLSGMFLWLWIELTCGLAPIFQYHFSLLESGYGSDVTWLNSNPIWLFFCCSSLGNQETSCTKLHMRWNHVQDPRGKPRVSFRIVLGSVGISARLFLL